MSYIVMGRDECGDEFRPSANQWTQSADADRELTELRERFPEARALWVEMLKDKAYFSELRSEWDDPDIDPPWMLAEMDAGRW
jgi:RNA binding exosome subunit